MSIKKTTDQPMPNSEEIEQLILQISELTDALQRERADVTNVRRQHEEQLSNLKEMVKSQIVRQLLPAIDNFERSLGHVPKALEGNEYVKGVQGVVKQFEDTLAQMGVERIKTVGEVFDPILHEAVSMENDDTATDAQAIQVEIVSEELQSGYRLGTDVIRHAMVKVKMVNKKEK